MLAALTPTPATAAFGQVTEFTAGITATRPRPRSRPARTGTCGSPQNGAPDAIGRITPLGVVTHVPCSLAGADPADITAGPDGNMWFTADAGATDAIGRITPAGVITEFTACSRLAQTRPTSPPDPTATCGSPTTAPTTIGRITTAGAITESCGHWPDPNPTGIAAGPDGNLWFTEPDGANGRDRADHHRLCTAHRVRQCRPTAPTRPTSPPDPVVLSGSPSCGTNKIGRITTAGVVSESAVIAGTTAPTGITAGPDGNLWFTEQAAPPTTDRAHEHRWCACSTSSPVLTG